MSKGEGINVIVKFSEKLTNSIDNINLPDYPEISGYTTTSEDGSTTTMTIPNEAKVGDLLIMFFAKDDDPLYSTPEGWIILGNSYDTNLRILVCYKFYEGEDKTFTMTHDDEQHVAAVVSIPYGGIPTISSVASATNTTTLQTSPLTPGFDIDSPTRWISFIGCDYRSVTGFPSNFTDNNISVGYTNGVGLGIASGKLAAKWTTIED